MLDQALTGATLPSLYTTYVTLDLVPMLFGGIIPTDIQGIYRSGVPTLSTAVGLVKATGRIVYFPSRRLKPGRYVYALRLAATMNPQRVSVLVGPAFRVGRARR